MMTTKRSTAVETERLILRRFRESCQAVIDAAFARGIHRIYAECDPENEKSWHLLERLGFTREACFRQNVYFWKDGDGNPIWKDTFVYGLLNNK